MRNYRINNTKNQERQEHGQDSITNRWESAIMGLYYLTPQASWFSIQLVDEATGTVLDAAEFSKNNEAERNAGERHLKALARTASVKAGCLRILSELKIGFGYDCKVTVYCQD